MLRRWLLLAVIALPILGAVAAPKTAPTDSLSVAAGAKLFTQYCETCHGKTGKGDGPTGKTLNPKPRNFQNPAQFKSKSDEALYKVINKGGASVGLSPLMVAWGSVLKEPQIWQVIAYIHTFLPPGAKLGVPAAK